MDEYEASDLVAAAEGRPGLHRRHDLDARPSGPGRGPARPSWPRRRSGSELVLDVTRNALNKIAVALGADAAHVEDGIEIYDVDADGELVYGLTLD